MTLKYVSMSSRLLWDFLESVRHVTGSGWIERGAMFPMDSYGFHLDHVWVPKNVPFGKLT